MRKSLTLSCPNTVSYILQKGSIVGPSMKLPFVGPFLESMDPKFDEYLAKWESGPLSCVSVFHKYAWPLPSAPLLSFPSAPGRGTGREEDDLKRGRRTTVLT